MTSDSEAPGEGRQTLPGTEKEGDRVTTEEQEATRRELLRQLEDPYLTEHGIKLIERKLEILNSQPR